MDPHSRGERHSLQPDFLRRDLEQVGAGRKRGLRDELSLRENFGIPGQNQLYGASLRRQMVLASPAGGRVVKAFPLDQPDQLLPGPLADVGAVAGRSVKGLAAQPRSVRRRDDRYRRTVVERPLESHEQPLGTNDVLDHVGADHQRALQLGSIERKGLAVFGVLLAPVDLRMAFRAVRSVDPEVESDQLRPAQARELVAASRSDIHDGPGAHSFGQERGTPVHVRLIDEGSVPIDEVFRLQASLVRFSDAVVVHPGRRSFLVRNCSDCQRPGASIPSVDEEARLGAAPARRSSARHRFLRGMTRVFDCFTFNDELDLLELRLELGDPYVDFFVIVEASRTFSGGAKPLHFARNRERFRRYLPKLRHIVVDDLPVEGDRWNAEVAQRNAILRGLHDAEPNDVIIVCDCDELIHPEVLATLRNGCSGLTGLEMFSTFRYANWELPLGKFPLAARAAPFCRLSDPHHQRNHQAPDTVIRDAGRHLTTLGDIPALISKFENYSHSEMDNSLQKSEAFLRRAHTFGVNVFSPQLVTVRGPSELSPVQRGLLARRPDLFDFSILPPWWKRQEFRYYAMWRARQPVDSSAVPRLDRSYDSDKTAVARKAAASALRHAGRTTRGRLGDLKRRALSRA